MTFLYVHNRRTGARRFYLDGKRATLDAYTDAKWCRRLDSFRTIMKGHTVFQYCEGRG